jgi:RND family efflux transporter MFP subunit
MRRFALVVLLAVLLGGASLLWLKGRTDKNVEATVTAAPIAVDVVRPQRGHFSRLVEVFGSISAKTTTEVKSEVPGRVVHVSVKEWDHVGAGKVLARIDPTDFEIMVQRGSAGLKMAKARLLQSRVDLSRAQREWKRAAKLKDGGLVTGQELDERRSGVESAAAQVALAEAQVAEAEAQVAEARHRLGKTSVAAPIEGTVSQRHVDVGDFVDTGELLFTMVDNRVLDFTAHVPATDLPEMREGQLLSFTVDGLPERTFAGRVKRVNPTVSISDRAGRVLAEVENGEGLLKAGMFARGQVVVEERHEVWALPREALGSWDLDRRRAKVLVVADGTARSHEIETGLVNQEQVEVRSGLSGSELVVWRGGFRLRDGDRVQVSGQEGAP